MKRSTYSQNRSPLLDYAISRLSPEVFTHPVWMRFGKKALSSTPSLVDDLLSAAKNLQDSDPGTACQVLLICAVFQNCGGQHFKALQTIRRTLALAESCSLVKESLWAIWGACAISVRQGNYDQAGENLVDLKAALSQQDEWILADFVEVLRQSFFQHGTVSKERLPSLAEDLWSDDMLDSTLEWLQNWGFSAETLEPEAGLASKYRGNNASQQSAWTQSFFSIQRLQGRWHTLMLAIRGELRLQWEAHESDPTKKRFSLWAAILSSLRLHISGREDDPRVTYGTPPIADRTFLPSPKGTTPARPASRTKKQTVKSKKDISKRRTAPAATIVPVSVHMLGSFSLTIGDLTVKLSSSRGLSILKYLLFHHKQSTSREVLMDIFWPDADPETARNSLNVAIHGLRKALRNAVFLPVIIFEDGGYRLEENLQVWLDVEEFEQCVKAGQRLEARDQLTAAVTEYETAISLYQGDLLEQTPYEEWTVFDRERMRIAYLDTLDRLSQIYFQEESYSACRTACQLILIKDPCREDAHCLLMRCYSRQRQPHLALYQYQICVEALQRELQVEPAPETTQLYNRIRRREQV